MIPFNLETWKANPDCEVWTKPELLENPILCRTGWNELIYGSTKNVDRIFSEEELTLKLPETKPRPNANVIHAFADGLDVYFDWFGGWAKYGGSDCKCEPTLGDPAYKWHIGKPEE